MGSGTERDARGAPCPSSWVLLPEQSPAVGRGRGGSQPQVGWISWDCKLQLGGLLSDLYAGGAAKGSSLTDSCKHLRRPPWSGRGPELGYSSGGCAAAVCLTPVVDQVLAGGALRAACSWASWCLN